jgi:hypothetical protein
VLCCGVLLKFSYNIIRCRLIVVTFTSHAAPPTPVCRWVWLVRSCSPSRLPIIRSIIGSHGNDQVAATTGESVCEPSLCCDSESCGHSGILHSILSSWISSVTVMWPPCDYHVTITWLILFKELFITIRVHTTVHVYLTRKSTTRIFILLTVIILYGM